MSIKTERTRRLIFSHLYQPILANKEFTIWQKDFSVLRMKNDLFISRERKESQPFFMAQ